MTYDVIISGAGFSGAACAWMLAEQGHQVLLIDQKPREQLGQAYPRLMIDIDTFSKADLERSQGDELLGLLDLFYAYSPSAEVRKPIDFSALMLDGTRFQQRLLDQGQAAGVTFEQATVSSAVIEANQVVGLNLSNGEQREASLVIDATGNAQALVQELVSQGLLYQTQTRDLDSAYGLAYRLSCSPADISTSELHIHFCIQGGYLWRSAFDIGLGMMSQTQSDLETVRTTVQDFAERYGWQNGEIIQEDMGQIPVRYPLLNLVANGFAVLGDAAFMVNSVRGGGVSAGIKGARILAEVANTALQARDLSADQLWTYNQRYQKEVGIALAYQDVMRQALMNEDTDNMEFALKKEIITADDIKGSLSGRLLDLSTGQKLQKGLRGASNPALLLRMNHKLEWAKHLYQQFKKYPASAAGFSAWQVEVNQILEKVRA